jgi:acylphosphatase
VSNAVRKRVVVSGRVQGVFFRDSCAKEAQRLGIAGSVRNTSDGEVEAFFEGEPSAVDEIVTWCRQGPSHADVDSVDVTDEQPTSEKGFRVE